VVDSIRAYWWIVAMWIRSNVAYRASFVMLTLGQFAGVGLEFVGILIMFMHTDALGGFDLAEIAFLYGTSGVAIGMADLLLGSIEKIGTRIRDGSLDVMLIRPVPAFAQAAADQFGLRRIGRVLQATIVLVWSIWALDIDWTPDRILLIPVMLVCGTVIFSGIFVLGAAFQFAAGDAAEVASAFTYGGNFLTQYPPTIFARELVRTATFIVPLAFVNWMPAMHVLGREDPLGLPKVFEFGSPVAALLVALVAGLAWRAALRSYRSTGS
jgi:ABC-2 type transport system permease protein